MKKKNVETKSVVEDVKNSVSKKTGKKAPVSDGLHIPKTVQQSIPYIRVYENGIIETEKGRYSKSYKLDDVNFQIA